MGKMLLAIVIAGTVVIDAAEARAQYVAKYRCNWTSVGGPVANGTHQQRFKDEEACWARINAARAQNPTLSKCRWQCVDVGSPAGARGGGGSGGGGGADIGSTSGQIARDAGAMFGSKRKLSTFDLDQQGELIDNPAIERGLQRAQQMAASLTDDKVVEEAPALAAIERTSPALLREAVPRRPTCEELEAKADKLERGLGTQKDALAKMNKMVELARADRDGSLARAKEIAKQRAIAILQGLPAKLTRSQRVLRDVVKRLKKAKIPKAARRRLFDTLKHASDKIDELTFAKETQAVERANRAKELNAQLWKPRLQQAESLLDALVEVHKLLDNNDLGLEIVRDLAGSLNPLLALKIELAEMALSVGVELLSSAASSGEYDRLVKYQGIMELAYSTRQMEIGNLRDQPYCQRGPSN